VSRQLVQHRSDRAVSRTSRAPRAALAPTRLAMPALDSVPLAAPRPDGGVERAHRALSAPTPGVSPPSGERRTDRPAAKAVWILELPGRSGTIHLMHHCRGFACSCHDLKTSGAVHTSFIVKLSANWLTSNCCAVQHDSEHGSTGNLPYSFPPYSSRYAAAHRSRCGRGEALIAGMAVA
jgi:hypothetical protein